MNNVIINGIKDYEQLIDMDNNYTPIPMYFINSYIIYINQDDCIEKITCDKIQLEMNHNMHNSMINKNDIIQLINSNKTQTKLTKYKFDNMFLFNIDLNHSDLKTFIEVSNVNNMNKQFFKNISFMSNVIIPPSLFIFHNINALYFIFKETPIHKFLNTENQKIKSILKNNNDKRERHTKKVRFNNINNKTRKTV